MKGVENMGKKQGVVWWGSRTCRAVRHSLHRGRKDQSEKTDEKVRRTRRHSQKGKILGVEWTENIMSRAARHP
jgi:uncharacterized protein YndB with AHSA1/START domain